MGSMCKSFKDALGNTMKALVARVLQVGPVHVCFTVTRVKMAERRCRSMPDYVRIVRSVGPSMSQRDTEIMSLITAASRLPLNFVLEIGTFNGGAFYMLSKAATPSATLVTIDLDNDWKKTIVLKCLAQRRQKVHVIRGDSHSEGAVARVTRVLGSSKVDLLFIDGDHRWDGVSADFKAYSSLVRPGGIVAFHDIVPDHRSKYGVETPGWSGDVPEFWKMIKPGFRTEQFVETEDQDGMGIGYLEWR